MSLTRFIERAAVRAAWKEWRIPVRVADEPPAKVKPVSSAHSVVGTAFDYLARIKFRRDLRLAGLSDDVGGPVRVEEGVWVADHGLRLLQETIDVIPPDVARLVPAYSQWLPQVHGIVEDYVAGNDAARERVIRASHFLAWLDTVYRTSTVSRPFHKGEAIVIELNRLEAGFKPLEIFHPERYVALNPDFGGASFAVGGADGDLIVDDCMIDIKTTIKGKPAGGQILQLVGYMILDSLHRAAAGPIERPSLRGAGLYMARQDVLYRWDVDDILLPGGMDAMKAVFLEEIAGDLLRSFEARLGSSMALATHARVQEAHGPEVPVPKNWTPKSARTAVAIEVPIVDAAEEELAPAP